MNLQNICTISKYIKKIRKMSAFYKSSKEYFMVFNIITARISYLFSALRCSSKTRVPILTTLLKHSTVALFASAAGN
jgi:hypothetical protein